MKIIQCSKCFGEATDQIIYRNRDCYKCHVCGNIAPLLSTIDSRLKLSLDKDSTLYHFSVGFILENEKGEILILKKRLEPVSWTVVFGHVHSGETIEEASRRELMESTGLTFKKAELLFKKIARGICPIGAKKHLIHVFKIKINGNAPIALNKNFSESRWMDSKKLKDKLPKPLAPGTEFVFRKLKIIKSNGS